MAKAMGVSVVPAKSVVVDLDREELRQLAKNNLAAEDLPSGSHSAWTELLRVMDLQDTLRHRG